ncbi:hypothetical protein COLO4_24851 [Corchorus olitorius]|uniref:Uncharacterized protein n=1 Tax=Corchorus olitorius TaxID=93759 RepID=A0A1R3I6B0_9ROSI|nr:hypothetical protein COLO4_24851 [Corchorus olitorius]
MVDQLMDKITSVFQEFESHMNGVIDRAFSKMQTTLTIYSSEIKAAIKDCSEACTAIMEDLAKMEDQSVNRVAKIEELPQVTVELPLKVFIGFRPGGSLPNNSMDDHDKVVKIMYLLELFVKMLERDNVFKTPLRLGYLLGSNIITRGMLGEVSWDSISAMATFMRLVTSLLNGLILSSGCSWSCEARKMHLVGVKLANLIYTSIIFCYIPAGLFRFGKKEHEHVVKSKGCNIGELVNENQSILLLPQQDRLLIQKGIVPSRIVIPVIKDGLAFNYEEAPLDIDLTVHMTYFYICLGMDEYSQLLLCLHMTYFYICLGMDEYSQLLLCLYQTFPCSYFLLDSTLRVPCPILADKDVFMEGGSISHFVLELGKISGGYMVKVLYYDLDEQIGNILWCLAGIEQLSPIYDVIGLIIKEPFILLQYSMDAFIGRSCHVRTIVRKSFLGVQLQMKQLVNKEMDHTEMLAKRLSWIGRSCPVRTIVRKSFLGVQLQMKQLVNKEMDHTEMLAKRLSWIAALMNFEIFENSWIENSFRPLYAQFDHCVIAFGKILLRDWLVVIQHFVSVCCGLELLSHTCSLLAIILEKVEFIQLHQLWTTSRCILAYEGLDIQHTGGKAKKNEFTLSNNFKDQQQLSKPIFLTWDFYPTSHVWQMNIPHCVLICLYQYLGCLSMVGDSGELVSILEDKDAFMEGTNLDRIEQEGDCRSWLARMIEKRWMELCKDLKVLTRSLSQLVPPSTPEGNPENFPDLAHFQDNAYALILHILKDYDLLSSKDKKKALSELMNSLIILEAVSKVESDKVLLDKKLEEGEIMPDEYMRRSEALLNKWKQAWSEMAQGLANFDGCVGEEEDYDWNLNQHEEFVQGLDRELCALIRINGVCVVNTFEDLQLLVSVGMECNIIVERDNEKLISVASSFESVIAEKQDPSNLDSLVSEMGYPKEYTINDLLDDLAEKAPSLISGINEEEELIKLVASLKMVEESGKRVFSTSVDIIRNFDIATANPVRGNRIATPDEIILGNQVNCSLRVLKESMKTMDAFEAPQRLKEFGNIFEKLQMEKVRLDARLERHQKTVEALDEKLRQVIRPNRVCVVNTLEDLQLLSFGRSPTPCQCWVECKHRSGEG